MRSFRAMEKEFEYHITVYSLRLERPVRSLSPKVKNMVFWTLVHAHYDTSGLKHLLQLEVWSYTYCPHVGHLLHFPWRESASFPSGKGETWGVSGYYWAFPLQLIWMQNGPDHVSKLRLACGTWIWVWLLKLCQKYPLTKSEQNSVLQPE